MAEHSPEASHPNDIKLAQLADEYRKISEAPPGGDRYIGDFAEAMVESLNNNQNLRNVVKYALGIRQSQDIEHTAHVIRVSLQRHLQHEDGYPFNSPSEWVDAMQPILDTPMPGLIADIAWRNVQTNVPGRYKSLVMTLPFLTSLSGRKNKSLTGLDVGTSHMQGPKKIAYMDKYPFDPIEVVEPSGEASKNYQVNESLQDRINELIKKNPRIGKWVGIDLWPLRDNYELQWDIENDEWIRTCSFRLAEVAEDSDKIREYDSLAHEPIPKGFSYRDMDFSVPGATVTDKNGEPIKFDFAFYSTSLYQAEAGDERAEFINNGELNLKDDGLLIVQDSVRVDDTAENGLRFYGFKGTVPDYSYTTLVKDMSQPEAGFQEIWRWSDSRCTRLLCDLASLSIGGKFSRRVAAELSA